MKINTRFAKNVEKNNKIYGTNFKPHQILILKKSLHIRNPTKNFGQYFDIFLKNYKKYNVNYYDFYLLKEMLIKNVNNLPRVQNEEKYISRYNITKGKKLYKEYCKLKTKKWNTPELQQQKSLKFQKKRKENPEMYNDICDNQIGYWLKKGYIEEESKELVKQRQTTFSLEKCIKKYGEDKGTKRWEERQEKWKNTLNNKPQEEIDDINRRKSSGINRYLDRNVPGKLYYIYFYNNKINFWKIGITSNKNIENGRFNDKLLFKKKYNLNYNIEFINEYDTIQECYDKEQFILKAFNNYRITIDENGFKTTEAFSQNVLKDWYESNI